MSSGYVGYDVNSGKPKRKCFYGKTQREASNKLKEAQARSKSGIYTEPSKQLFADWMDTWINDYMKPSLRVKTWESYEMISRLHIKPALGHIKLFQLHTHHLQKLYNDKLKRGRLDGKPGGLSHRTVRYIHTIIHGSLEQARREGHILINPAAAAKLPKPKQKEIKYWETEDLTIFLANAKGTLYYPLYLLEVSTGLRIGELLALRWKDIDLNSCTLTVSQGVVRTRQGLIIQPPKTKLANRTLNLPDTVIQELTDHREKQKIEADERIAAGKYYEDNNLVFSTRAGKLLDPKNIVRNFHGILSKAGLEKVNFHALRHTYVTLNIQEGIDLKTIQENIGHHSVAFTMDIYGAVTKKMKKSASDKFGKLIEECVKDEEMDGD